MEVHVHVAVKSIILFLFLQSYVKNRITIIITYCFFIQIQYIYERLFIFYFFRCYNFIFLIGLIAKRFNETKKRFFFSDN